MVTIELVNEYLGDPPDPDFSVMDEAALLAFIGGTARTQARLEACRLQAIEHYARRREGDEWIADHLACEVNLSIARADRDLALAYALTHRLPGTLRALRGGELDRARVDTIHRATVGLTDEHAQAVDARLYPAALAWSPGQLARRVRTLVAEVDPEGAAARAAIQRQERRVSMDHDVDGMAWLNVYLIAEDATACWDRITRLARETHAGDGRTRNQVRADVVRDLLLGTRDSSTTAHIYVTVDAETLLGLAHRAGELRGCGPLPAERVRDLAYRLNAEWSGVLLDHDGLAAAITPRTYRFRGRLAELIRLRDRTCDFPACNRAAEHTDIDHTIPYERGGPTNPFNGHCRCRRHHRAKQSPFWTVTQGADGASRWTSHHGTTYTNRPQPLTTTPPPF